MSEAYRNHWTNRIVGHGEASPDDLVPHPANWRTHPRAQRLALGSVLDRVGWVQDIVVSRRSGRLVDGHLRVALASERGETSVPVVYVDLDEAEERLVLATLDPLAAMAGVDEEALSALTATVALDDAGVRALLESVLGSQSAPPVVDDEIPPPGPPVSQVGDLWQLDDHRLLCGDATDPADVGRVLGGEPARWLWTDPPYGVSYTGKTRRRLTIDNDGRDVVERVVRPAFAAADRHLVDGAPIYVAHPAGASSVAFGAAFLAAGWHLHQTLVWVKDALVLGHSDYHYRHEPVLYGWKGERRRWYGGRTRDSVSEVPRPRRSEEHPTAKPLALVAGHLRNSSRAGELGLDLFVGSGSTLVAAEQLRRRCAALELDPRYVDVAVRRWQRLTGRDAVLVPDGRRFAEVEEARRGR